MSNSDMVSRKKPQKPVPEVSALAFLNMARHEGEGLDIKGVFIAIVGLWIAVLLHAWATRFTLIPVPEAGPAAYLVNRMTGEVYPVQGFGIIPPQKSSVAPK